LDHIIVTPFIPGATPAYSEDMRRTWRRDMSNSFELIISNVQVLRYRTYVLLSLCKLLIVFIENHITPLFVWSLLRFYLSEYAKIP